MRRAGSRCRRAPPSRRLMRSRRSRTDRQERDVPPPAPMTARCSSITSGDRRVDEGKLPAQVGPDRPRRRRVRQGAHRLLDWRRFAGRHVQTPLTLIDCELFRFAEIWAAAGHPNAVFRAGTGAAAPARAGCGGGRCHAWRAQSRAAGAADRMSHRRKSLHRRVPDRSASAAGAKAAIARSTRSSRWSSLGDLDKRRIWKLLPARRAARADAGSGTDRPEPT